MGHYDFNKDLAKAQCIEERVIVHLKKEHSDMDFHGFSHQKGYDCHFSMGGVYYKLEIKSDYHTNHTGNIVIEYESRGYESGITTTQANLLAYAVITPKGLDIYLFTVKRIRDLIADEAYHAKLVGGDIGSNTRMYVFKLDEIEQYAKKTKEY